MQERVIQTAKRLGYVPNATAKNLKTNFTHTIGILVSDISNPDYIASSEQ
jgi:DNA-binding LacI/PurR family transcriptional regulator